MEEVRGGAAVAGLPADRIGEEAFAGGAFAVGYGAGGDFGGLESWAKGERSMRFALWGRKQREEELQEEIRAHLTLAEHEGMELGRPGKEARAAARREFGNVSIAEETTRDMWGSRWLSDFFQDLRYAFRTLRLRPGFATVVVLTLAVGIGANSAAFSLVDSAFLRALPFREPERLVPVWTTDAAREPHTPSPGRKL